MVWNPALPTLETATSTGGVESRKFVAGWAQLCNAHRFDEAATLVAEDAELNDRRVGPDGLVRPMRRMVASFPDWHWNVNRMVVEQDLVAVHMSATGTHLGEFLGIRPTGKSVRVGEFLICEVRDQRVAKVWSGLDVAALRTQLESAAS